MKLLLATTITLLATRSTLSSRIKGKGKGKGKNPWDNGTQSKSCRVAVTGNESGFCESIGLNAGCEANIVINAMISDGEVMGTYTETLKNAQNTGEPTPTFVGGGDITCANIYKDGDVKVAILTGTLFRCRVCNRADKETGEIIPGCSNTCASTDSFAAAVKELADGSGQYLGKFNSGGFDCNELTADDFGVDSKGNVTQPFVNADAGFKFTCDVE